MGVPQILFILALAFFAAWKKTWIRVIIAVGLAIWGGFALDYDIKIAAPLMTLGVVLFFMGIYNVVKQSRGEPGLG